MNRPPSRLRAARLAAAEVFIAEGLDGTSVRDAGSLRRTARVAIFRVAYTTRVGPVDVNVGYDEDDVKVWVQTHGTAASADDTSEFALVLQRAVDVARKVEAAIAEALR